MVMYSRCLPRLRPPILTDLKNRNNECRMFVEAADGDPEDPDAPTQLCSIRDRAWGCLCRRIGYERGRIRRVILIENWKWW